MSMYTLKLNDGSEIENLMLTGNIFRSDKEITRAMLAGKLTPVTIEGESGEGEDEQPGITGVHEHMAVCYVRKSGGKYELALRDIPGDEWDKLTTLGDLEYLAMMAGIEL